jgi:hypothetical protein
MARPSQRQLTGSLPQSARSGEGEPVPELDSLQDMAYAVWLNTY